MKIFAALLILLTLVAGCQTKKPSGQPAGEESAPSYALTELWRTDTVLRTCESVLFDSQREVLFVSCINGAPAEKNGKGFIAMLDPGGGVKSLEWVTGLDAPKGMGVHGDLLFVNDIDRLVIIHIEKAEVAQIIPVEGASFLNDIAIGPGGRVYLSDSDTGFIWIYHEGRLTAWITEGLDRPNGLYVEPDRVLLASSGSEDLKVIDRETGTFKSVTPAIGDGDGLEYTGQEGHYLVSSWSGEVFLVLPDFSKISLLKTSDQGINSADIGFNIAEQVVYIPTFFDNRVVAYKLVKE